MGGNGKDRKDRNSLYERVGIDVEWNRRRGGEGDDSRRLLRPLVGVRRELVSR